MMRKLSYLKVIILSLFIQTGNIMASEVGRFKDIGANFELESAEGKLITEKSLLGNYTLLAFGFTHCLHICPMIAANMAMTLKIGPENARGIFVSVDTERDTPAITQAYASAYSQSMTGLSGSYEQIRQAANNFNISYVVTKSQKAYTVEHTSDIFLIGPDGKVLQVFALNASAKDIAAAMRPLAE
jgi:protein SCO1/2